MWGIHGTGGGNAYPACHPDTDGADEYESTSTAIQYSAEVGTVNVVVMSKLPGDTLRLMVPNSWTSAVPSGMSVDGSAL